MIKNTIMRRLKTNILRSSRNLSDQRMQQVGTHVRCWPSEALSVSSLVGASTDHSRTRMAPYTARMQPQMRLRVVNKPNQLGCFFIVFVCGEEQKALSIYSLLEWSTSELSKSSCLWLSVSARTAGQEMAINRAVQEENRMSVCGPQEAQGRVCLKTWRNLCRWAYCWSCKGQGGIEGIRLFNLSSYFYTISWRNTGSQLNQRVKEHPWTKWVEIFWSITHGDVCLKIIDFLGTSFQYFCIS